MYRLIQNATQENQLVEAQMRRFKDRSFIRYLVAIRQRYLVALARKESKSSQRRLRAAFRVELLEPRALMAADLTSVFLSSILPSPPLQGTSGSAIVTVQNIGNQASNRLDVGLYLSTDAILDASDLAVGSASSGGGISAGKSKDFTVPFTISTQLDPGIYRLLAKADNTNLTAENSETNNDAVGGNLNVIWQFGYIQGKAGLTPITLRDSDGTSATFSLVGPGLAVITKSGGLWDVNVSGSDSTTALNISTTTGGNGRLTLNTIRIAGALGSLTAPTTDLLGALTINNGPLPVVNAGTIAGGVVLANSAPVANADSAEATENGAAVSIDVLANDTDVNIGDTKTIVSVSSPGLQGSVAIAADGKSLVYSVGQAFNSLKAGATATESFAYTMRDTLGATSTAIVTVTITGTNDGPQAIADSASAQEHQSILIPVLANDTDPDTGDVIRILSIDRTGTVGFAGFASSGGVPMIYYTPNHVLAVGQTVADVFRYTIADQSGAQSIGTVTVTVVGINDAPTAVDDAVTISEDSATITQSVLTNDTDPDLGDTKSILAADGNGRAAQIVFNSPTQEVTTFYIIPAVPAIRGAISISGDAQSISYTPTASVQSLRAGETLSETIFYTMRDAGGATSSARFVVTVLGANDAPTAVADQISIGKNAAPVTINVLANDTDPDSGDTKTIVAMNTTGLRGAVALSPSGNSVVYTVGNAFADLLPGQSATETWSYTLQDSFGARSTALVTILVTGDNSAPTAVNDTASAVENGSPVTIDVLSNDLDPDVGQGHSIISISSIGLQGAVSVTAGGSSVIYTIGQAFQSLRAGETTTEQFTYTMADAAGAQSTATVTVTVTGANDNPLAIVDATSLSEDSLPIVVNVLANDTDVDAGDTKRVVAVNVTNTRGSVTITDDGQGVRYDVGSAYQYLREGITAIDRFTYTMSDGAGALSTATVSITVVGSNDGPIAVADSATVSEDAISVTINALANDFDIDAGDTKTMLSIDTTGLLGTIRIAPGGGLVYTPSQSFQSLTNGQSQIETFQYTMRDGAGSTSSATVTITVIGVTDGPKAIADSTFAHEDAGPITINVLSNDTNDGNPSDVMRITAIDGAGRYSSPITGFFDGAVQLIGIAPGFARMLGSATITPDGRSILYTPMQSLNAGESGVDTFIYSITGSAGGTSSAVVTINVTGANDAPVAINDSVGVSIGSGAAVISVLANDIDPDTRIDPPRLPIPPSDFSELIYDPTPVDVPDTKTIVSINATGLQGSVTLAPGGSNVTYNSGGTLLNLAFGQTATETFTYTMQDSLGLQSTATVAVTVTGTNHAPVAVGDSATAIEDGSLVTIDILSNDSDADTAFGDSISLVSISATVLQGTVAIQGNSIVYNVGNAFQNLKAGATATELFTYTIRDNRGAHAIGTVTVTVVGTNDGPLAVNDGLTISEDAPAIAVSVLANDTDIDIGDTKTVVSVNAVGLQGTVAISADGSSVIYTIGDAFQYLESGVDFDTFSYTMRDGSGAISTAVVTITVLGAPESPPPGSILGTAGNDILNTGAANDVIYGQAGDDTISSGAGNDTLYGGAGRDTLNGGDGNDILVGGADRDDLTGGLGADMFAYAVVSDSTAAAQDRIRDFNAAQGDKIDLRQIDANTLVNGNGVFVLSTSFTRMAGQLVLTQIAGGYLVAGDVNGDGIADLQIEVRTADILNAGHFLL